MSEPEATPAGDAPPDATAAPVFDPSVIRGLQVFAPAGESPAEGVDEDARKAALAQALMARAARLSEAVDDALTLANDGAIRWLGDPVGKLIAGAALLEPRAALLADEALPPEGREIAERRLSLWLAAHMRKSLGPLLALADAEGAPEAARSVGLKVSQALGVLDRERVKAEVKALDQEARGVLRKLGVRFGAHYIYVPALLKPGARTLCAQLWALAEPNVDQDATERLLHFAASGRTSFAVEPPAPAEICRIAGFRLCGDRAVRVDIVERLSDLIRAALPRAPTTGPIDEADGFVVTGQMTSLTGCSGEPFASILRSLGFVSHPVKKSAHLAAIARRAAAAAAATIEAATIEAAAPPPAAEGEPPPASRPAETELAATEAAAPAVDAAADADPVEKDVAEPIAEAVAEPAPADEPIANAPAPPIEEPAEGPPVAAEETAAEAVAEAPAAESFAEPAAPELASTEPAAAEVVAQAPSSEAASGEPEPAEEETIEVWRPAPRRPRHQHQHRHSQRHDRRHGGPPPQAQAAEAPVEGRDHRHDDRGGRKPWRERRGSGDGGGRPAGGEARPEGRPNEERRGPPPWRREANGKGGRRDERRDDRREEEGRRPDNKGKPRPQPAEPSKPNLDSPFAKLLDLKPLLQARDKNR